MKEAPFPFVTCDPKVIAYACLCCASNCRDRKAAEGGNWWTQSLDPSLLVSQFVTFLKPHLSTGSLAW